MNLLQAILCPAVTGIAEITDEVPVVGPVVDALPALLCSINVLGYVYKTTYVPASGPPVVKYTRAIASAPTLLNVDGVGLIPDFIGLLGINLKLNGLNLQIQRSVGFPAGAKVSIEAIAMLPTTTPGTRTFVGFGEDGLAAGTAGHWMAKASVLGLSNSTVDLGLDITTSNPPSTLAVIGEMFSGANADAPDRTYRGNAKFTPVPASFKTRLKLADNRQQILVNTTPTKLDAKMDILTPGAREQNITATVDQVPSSIDVVHTSGPGDTETVTYDASAGIAKVTGAYRDKVGGNIQTAAALDAWGDPCPHPVRPDRRADLRGCDPRRKVRPDSGTLRHRRRRRAARSLDRGVREVPPHDARRLPGQPPAERPAVGGVRPGRADHRQRHLRDRARTDSADLRR